jgi:gliding motility-associated-like protein
VVPITVNPIPQIDATASDDDVKFEDEVQLTVTANGAYNYIWIPADQLDNDTTTDPLAIMTRPTLFIVSATDTNGCRKTDSIFVNMIDECSEDYVFVPNGFSPNNDGVNDCFGVLYAPPHTEYKMVIFNRWGEEIFQSLDINTCWNGAYKGSDVLMDSYSFVIGFKCYNGKFIMKKGTITLLR